MSDPPDHESFMRLWVRHQTQVYAYIRTLVFDRADAEDILQEVAVVLWRKFDQFERGTRFDQWAYRVAHNQILYYRQRKRRDAFVFSPDLIEAVAEQAAGNQPCGDYIDALESCLDRLSGDDRDLVRRRYEPGATNRSVSKVLERSESTISRALNRIYIALLRCIHAETAVDAMTRGTQ